MSEVINIKELNERIERESVFVDTLRSEMGKVIIGQNHLIDTLLIGLLSNGHILLEGVPGLAKTLAITTLAKAVDADFSRIQFTPDLLPADLIGTLIYSQKNEEFVVKKGPVFANFVLADEINRSPAKVQSALLEAMQERQVTIGDNTYPLPQPFLVLATQNPLEQEGTYPLPEAQVDRFMLKAKISYPKKQEERDIVRMNLAGGGLPAVNKVISPEDIVKARKVVEDVYMDEKIEKFSVMRSLLAVERADVCVIMIDATEGVTEQDTKVAGEAHNAGKACIIVVNKWDLVEKDGSTMKEYTLRVREGLAYMPYAPVLFISAQTGQRVDKLFALIHEVYEQNHMRIPTGRLNAILAEATARVQPPTDKGRRLRIFYMTQASTCPPTFVCFCNDARLFHFSYQRYLENQIREVFGLTGTPVRMVVRERGDKE